MGDQAMITASSSNAYQTDIEIDALPYIDREIEDGALRDEVHRMIEQEMRRMKRNDRSSLPKQIDLFQDNPILSQEWERVQKKIPLDALDFSRYEFKEPDDADNVDSWKNAVDNTKSQLESQACSVFNLELLKKYGANAWRVHNYQLEHYLKQVEKATKDYQQETLHINQERKADQMAAGKAIRSLESKWSDLISQNIQVEVACAALEAELEELRQYSSLQRE